ncbi:MAG TPA: ferritin family protein [Clostridiaceae bacterium]
MSKAELTIIRQGIVKELEGYEFYKMVSENTKNSLETKETFMQLANEEMKHANWLKEMYVKVEKGKLEDLVSGIELDVPAPGNAKWKNLKKDSASIPVAVFGMGINMEKASIEYYTKAAADTKIKEAKEFFVMLAKWEKTHLEFLSDEYEDMLVDWWADQGFAPF